MTSIDVLDVSKIGGGVKVLAPKNKMQTEEIQNCA
jgi:hypothetical protein